MDFAFISMQKSSVEVVKSINKFDIQVQPKEIITLFWINQKERRHGNSCYRGLRGHIKQNWRLSLDCVSRFSR